jgi:hypothetical protein
MEEFAEHPIGQKWVWDADEEIDVIELCFKGLDVAREIIKSRDAMQFQG